MPVHILSITHGHLHRAVCCCGAQYPYRSTPFAARLDLAAHKQEVEG